MPSNWLPSASVLSREHYICTPPLLFVASFLLAIRSNDKQQIMPRLFTRSRSMSGRAAPHQQDPDHNSAYLSLLDRDENEHGRDEDLAPGGSDAAQHRRPARHLRLKSLPQDAMVSRSWLAAAESRPSWTGERPPARKLVKEQNGSGRPSFSLELSESDVEKDKGIVRRQIARLKELYRRSDKPSSP
jgi:hypothetical protein